MEAISLKSNEYWGRRAGTLAPCPVTTGVKVNVIWSTGGGDTKARTTKRRLPLLRNANGTPFLGINRKWFTRSYKSKKG